MKSVGLIGLGVMGVFCAKELLKNNIQVVGYDPFASAAERAAEAGVQICDTPTDVAAKAPIVLMFVPGVEDTEKAVLGENGLIFGAAKGSIIINLSTVTPEVNVRMSEALAPKGVGFIDAPVLGSPEGVGSWAFALGGNDADIAAVQDILFILSGSQERLFHLGPIGSGNVLKLLNNMMLGAINACAAETMALASHFGISQKTLIDVAVAANARTLSNAYKQIAERIAQDCYTPPTFTTDLLIKDNRLCLEMARDAGAPLVLGNAVDYVHRMAAAHGYGKLDHSIAWKSVVKNWQNKA